MRTVEIDRGGYGCHSPLRTRPPSIRSSTNTPARHGRRCEGCGQPLSLAVPCGPGRGGDPHAGPRRRVLTHFTSAIDAYRRAAKAGKWTPLEIELVNSASTPSSRRCTGMRSTRTGRRSEIPGRATSCSTLRKGGASSRTRITSEPRRLASATRHRHGRARKSRFSVARWGAQSRRSAPAKRR